MQSVALKCGSHDDVKGVALNRTVPPFITYTLVNCPTWGRSFFIPKTMPAPFLNSTPSAFTHFVLEKWKNVQRGKKYRRAILASTSSTTMQLKAACMPAVHNSIVRKKTYSNALETTLSLNPHCPVGEQGGHTYM